MERSRVHRCEQGTASLEAVLILGVFLVVYVGLLHMHKLQGNVLLARAKARTCAWHYSNAGCRGAMPAGCSEARATAVERIADDDNDRSIMDSITDLGVIGPLLGQVLGSSADVRVQRSVKHSAMFGDEDVTVGAGIYLMCNEHNRTAEEIAKDTACALVDSGSFIGSALGCGG